MLKIIEGIKEIQQLSRRLQAQGKSIGFVPTMGALHAGHQSLARRARKENDIVVVSIFVNPSQFGPKEDFTRYPRTLKADCELLKSEKADFVFCPQAHDIYPEGFNTFVEVSGLSDGLCGKFRPGHFRGVATVVLKLFNLVNPQRVYFGAKDFQQAAVIQKMIRDLNLGIQFCLCPTVREKDGLAMSSRNRYLTPEERERALEISRTLFAFRDEALKPRADLRKLKKKARERLEKAADKIDYFEAVDAVTLQPAEKISSELAVLTACFVGKTRLIDNVIIRNSVKSEK